MFTPKGLAPTHRLERRNFLAQLSGAGALSLTIAALVLLPALATGQTFVYVADFGISSGISAYRLDTTTGALVQVPGSPFYMPDWTDSLTVDPAGKFVYGGGLIY